MPPPPGLLPSSGEAPPGDEVEAGAHDAHGPRVGEAGEHVEDVPLHRRVPVERAGDAPVEAVGLDQHVARVAGQGAQPVPLAPRGLVGLVAHEGGQDAVVRGREPGPGLRGVVEEGRVQQQRDGLGEEGVGPAVLEGDGAGLAAHPRDGGRGQGVDVVAVRADDEDAVGGDGELPYHISDLARELPQVEGRVPSIRVPWRPMRLGCTGGAEVAQRWEELTHRG